MIVTLKMGMFQKSYFSPDIEGVYTKKTLSSLDSTLQKTSQKPSFLPSSPTHWPAVARPIAMQYSFSMIIQPRRFHLIDFLPDAGLRVPRNPYALRNLRRFRGKDGQPSWFKFEVAGGKNAANCYKGLQEACGDNVLPCRTVAREKMSH
ncbi:hypothetical protein TNCV_127221 [Trichonephila clavipes]|nr:hypothetical protein TNCV_127221 [Trichonephila clavipes]